ncbi:hypothetical protein ElyMa_005251400 [Elysia marginata]|uniref:Uncharacterized protein n=1 Tax=Elysia marginata TaxID=1093978 RepID=A0AAV4JX44_9GAST|nr:hypothetical protein ElyMa_005251400 [Elysia marginata]
MYFLHGEMAISQVYVESSQGDDEIIHSCAKLRLAVRHHGLPHTRRADEPPKPKGNITGTDFPHKQWPLRLFTGIKVCCSQAGAQVTTVHVNQSST